MITADNDVNAFYSQPILNSPYKEPTRHWELDEDHQPTRNIKETRRPADFITPVPKPKKKRGPSQASLLSDTTDEKAAKISNERQEYHKALINEIRNHVSKWRKLPKQEWKVSPITARLLEYWRTHQFSLIKPFFCQIEAVETAIWLTEVVPHYPKLRDKYAKHLLDAEQEHNPGLHRLALKMATGAGKTTVMAMLIAWQTLNAVRTSSPKFSKGFLVVAPGITIKDRLQVLKPNDPNNYYEERELVPPDLMGDLRRAVVVITNYHAFMLREKVDVSKGTRAVIEGWAGHKLMTKESEGEMIHRVMPELERMKNIIVMNDEAHHCYRERVENIVDEDFSDFKGTDKTDAKNEAMERQEAARVWISGLEAVARHIGISRVFDLSATPFFLAGSGYIEGTIFPWTLSDFSLMDAIECGIVKLPRIPVSDNVPSIEVPIYRNLWDNIRTQMPKKGSKYDPQALPVHLLTAMDALYGHYRLTFQLWENENISIPPCFIIVCNNTATSKQVYDYISGYWFKTGNNTKRFQPAKYPLFSNFGEDGTPLSRPRTLLIDSVQLEKGDLLDADFREAAKEEIDRFKAEIRFRGGKLAHEVERGMEIPDAAILREVMNTVGKKGQLGEQVRCVVSVGMLSEGWDANNVTHILGIRAFGTQLLCEQVIGRALRRQSYELNDQGLFDVEYADALGIPFDFSARPEVTPPPPPKEVTHIKAISPDRDGLEIQFPRIVGYRTELPPERLKADFTEDSNLILTPEITGPAETQNEGIFGEGVSLDLKDLSRVRDKTVLMYLTKYLLERHFRDGEGQPRLYLYGQLKKITSEWIQKYFHCERGTYPAQLLNRSLAELACDRISLAITSHNVKKGHGIQAIADPYNPIGTTKDVNFKTTKRTLWKTNPTKCHINYAVCDKSWELEFCRVLEKPGNYVYSYVKNHNLGFEVPYRFGGENHVYRPDFIVKIDDGQDKPMNLVVEIKGLRDEMDKQKKLTMESKWIPGVNGLKDFGRWDFIELKSLSCMEPDFLKAVERLRNGMPAAQETEGGLFNV